MSRQLNTVMLKLTDGEKVTIKTPSVAALERFRQALYKFKKDFDDAQFLLDSGYEKKSLKFEKIGASAVKISLYIPGPSILQFEICDNDTELPSDG